MYVEDFKPGTNTQIGLKDFFEIGSNTLTLTRAIGPISVRAGDLKAMHHLSVPALFPVDDVAHALNGFIQPDVAGVDNQIVVGGVFNILMEIFTDKGPAV